jgi:hypothetical protein
LPRARRRSPAKRFSPICAPAIRSAPSVSDKAFFAGIAPSTAENGAWWWI